VVIEERPVLEQHRTVFTEKLSPEEHVEKTFVEEYRPVRHVHQNLIREVRPEEHVYKEVVKEVKPIVHEHVTVQENVKPVVHEHHRVVEQINPVVHEHIHKTEVVKPEVHEHEHVRTMIHPEIIQQHIHVVPNVHPTIVQTNETRERQVGQEEWVQHEDFGRQIEQTKVVVHPTTYTVEHVPGEVERTASHVNSGEVLHSTSYIHPGETQQRSASFVNTGQGSYTSMSNMPGVPSNMFAQETVTNIAKPPIVIGVNPDVLPYESQRKAAQGLETGHVGVPSVRSGQFTHIM